MNGYGSLFKTDIDAKVRVDLLNFFVITFQPVGGFMTVKRILTRIIAPLSLFVLAACQTTPTTQTDAATPDAAAAPQTAQESVQETSPSQQEQARADGAPVAVFVASSDPRDGWQQVQLDVGSIYLNPQPVIVRDHLTGVQAGASEEGDGLLALELGPEGQSRLVQATTDHPNMRLAFIVGRTLLAAPSYDAPVTTPHLIFVVGTEQNALSAARAIAGVPDDGSGDDQGSAGNLFDGSGGGATGASGTQSSPQ